MKDPIERQEVIEAISGEIIVTGRENAKAVRHFFNLILDRIAHIPTAQQEELFEFGKWYDFQKGYVLEIVPEAFRISQVKDKEGDINERDT